MRTKNLKNIDLAEYFLDSVRNVLRGSRVVSGAGVTPRNRFRLKKWATTVRRNLVSLDI